MSLSLSLCSCWLSLLPCFFIFGFSHLDDRFSPWEDLWNHPNHNKWHSSCGIWSLPSSLTSAELLFSEDSEQQSRALLILLKPKTRISYLWRHWRTREHFFCCRNNAHPQQDSASSWTERLFLSLHFTMPRKHHATFEASMWFSISSGYCGLIPFAIDCSPECFRDDWEISVLMRKLLLRWQISVQAFLIRLIRQTRTSLWSLKCAAIQRRQRLIRVVTSVVWGGRCTPRLSPSLEVAFYSTQHFFTESCRTWICRCMLSMIEDISWTEHCCWHAAWIR